MDKYLEMDKKDNIQLINVDVITYLCSYLDTLRTHLILK